MAFDQIDRMTDLVEVFYHDRQRALAWMVTANPALANSIPRVLVLNGRGDQILEMLQDPEKIKEICRA